MVNLKIVNCWFSLSRVLGVSHYWAAYGKAHFLVSLVVISCIKRVSLTISYGNMHKDVCRD